jgi:hypothetical protein
MVMYRSYEDTDVNLSDLPPWAHVLIAVILVAVLFWVFVLPSLVVWVQINWIPISLVAAIVVIGTVFFFARRWKYKNIKRLERVAFEKEQTAKGLAKFVDRHRDEKWGKPKEVEERKKEDEKANEEESLFRRIVKEIEEFKPAKERLRHEYNYQLNLHGWLKRTFKSARIEMQRGSARPDIVIDNIAIEIKGPTRRAELENIASKLLRYPLHFERVVVVLFELDVNNQYYQDWLEGMNKKHPDVEIIEK